MVVGEYMIDNGMFGFGGTATVKFEADSSFGPDGKPKMEPLVLRVELRRPMNLLAWEVVGVTSRRCSGPARSGTVDCRGRDSESLQLRHLRPPSCPLAAPGGAEQGIRQRAAK